MTKVEITNCPICCWTESKQIIGVDYKPPIMVWRFEEAPHHLQELSTNGGDEDWIALIPPHLADGYIAWLETGAFGCCCINEIKMDDGSVVKIGCHA